MFTVFSDRIEILSRGSIPSGQTMEGFVMGESVPVNQKLSDIMLQLHISERTGRGVPKITKVYGQKTYEFGENSIKVTIPFAKISKMSNTQDIQINTQDIQINTQDTQVNTQDNIKNTQDSTKGTNRKNLGESTNERILNYCVIPKSRCEITEYLGYKDTRGVAKNYIKPLLEQGRLVMTIPDKPNSRNQKYLTVK